METIKLLLLVLKRIHGDQILAGFFAYFLFASWLLWILDKNITNWGDGLWLAFNIATSIGLGDYTVTSISARIVAVFLGLYGTVIVAFIPGMIASYYMEKVSVTANETIEEYYEDLEHVDTMKPTELKSLAEKIAARRNSL